MGRLVLREYQQLEMGRSCSYGGMTSGNRNQDPQYNLGARIHIGLQAYDHPFLT